MSDLSQLGRSDRYPILVERLNSDQALVIVCERCHWETEIGPEDIRNEMNYTCSRCRGPAVYKFEEAERCPNCGEMGHYSKALNYCCSRVCMLQAEYAKELEASRA
jgi:hypothetical protein